MQFRRFLTFILALLFLCLSVPAFARAGQADKVIALTFDDGPNATYTPQLLDSLAYYDAKATFFILGNSIKGDEAILRRMLADGHEIASHTYSHEKLTAITAEEVKSQLSRCASAIEKATGIRPSLIRPPYGSVNSEVRKICKQQGYTVVLWDVDTRDWDSKDPVAVAEKTIKSVKSGDIVLFHDRKETGIKAAALVMEALSKEGYRFVTVSELLGLEGMKSSGSPSSESGLSDLKPDSPADAPKSGSASKEEVFMPYRSGRTIGRVRFRTEPSTDAKSMLTFEKGVTLTVLSRCGDWYKVMYKGDTGYVYARYLKLK